MNAHRRESAGASRGHGDITRRGFLKLGVGGGGLLALSGCTADLQQPVAMQSYARAPEQNLSDGHSWYASTCRMCPAGCGIVVRVGNGRARKIEGNAAHPVNAGKLCARGQAGLQLLYHPDRVGQVRKRLGDRGADAWAATTWDHIVGELAGTLSAAPAGGVAFLTGQLPDQLATLVARFADGLGSAPPVVYDAQVALEGRAILSAANSAILGGAGVPYFDIAAADVVYAFESDFLATGLSPVAHNIAYGSMRSRPAGRGIMVSFEPRLSMTAASADRWVPIAPGTGGHVALALGRLLVAEGLVGNGVAPAFRRAFNGVDIEGIARLSGVDVDVLRGLAMHLGEARAAVAVPGGELGGHSNGLAAAKAVAALNGLLTAEATRPAAKSPPAAPQSRDLAGEPPGSYRDVAALVDRMARGAVDVLIIVGANPMYELPAALKFEAAMAKVPLVVSSAALMDDTARYADVVLPAATYLEAWGYEVVEPAVGGGAVGAQQPVARIRDDARDVGDALLAMARAMGGDAARRMPWPNMVAFIQSRLASLQSAGGNVTASDPGAFWAKWLQAGGWWGKAESAPLSSGDPAALLNLKVPEAQFDGPPGEYPLHLLPVASAAFGDGRHAGLPWLQELPDPTTSVTWNTWAELHPQTASDLRVGDGDIVEVVSPHGSIQAAVYVYPGIRPDVVAVPVGQGHAGLGRWASGRGANVLAILSPKAVPGTGHHAWAGTRVRVVATGDRRPLARLESPVGVDRAQAEDRPIG